MLNEIHPMFLLEQDCKSQINEYFEKFPERLRTTDYQCGSTFVVAYDDEFGTSYRLTAAKRNSSSTSRDAHYSLELLEKGSRFSRTMVILEDSVEVEEQVQEELDCESILKETSIKFRKSDEGFVRSSKTKTTHMTLQDASQVTNHDTVVYTTQKFLVEDDLVIEKSRHDQTVITSEQDMETPDIDDWTIERLPDDLETFQVFHNGSSFISSIPLASKIPEHDVLLQNTIKVDQEKTKS